MRSRKTLYILPIICALIVTAFFFRGSISADSNKLGEPVSVKTIEPEINGKKIRFYLEKYKAGNSFDFVLRKNSFIGNETSLKLTGFEDELSLCKTSSIKLQSGYALCLFGGVGVHSQNIQLVKYESGRLIEIRLQDSDSSLSANISSDVPNFTFVDRNNDGLLDLVVDDRNYSADPLIDSIRSYFINAGSGFVFDGKENITYNK